MSFSMKRELTDAEIEQIVFDHPNNPYEHVKRARRLLQYAEPGNVPWKILENEYFGPADYQDSDAGEPPQGAQW